MSTDTASAMPMPNATVAAGEKKRRRRRADADGDPGDSLVLYFLGAAGQNDSEPIVLKSGSPTREERWSNRSNVTSLITALRYGDRARL